jgi:ornithine decarboxylase/S-adenosylmethionine decarboxylase
MLFCFLSCIFRSLQVTTETGIRRLVPAADIDDYVFEPCGYSMNGILGGGFMTIHITPEQVSVWLLF